MSRRSKGRAAGSAPVTGEAAGTDPAARTAAGTDPAALSAGGIPDIIAQRIAARGPHADTAAVCSASDAVVAALSDHELRDVLDVVQPPAAQHADQGTRDAAELALRMYRDRFGYPFVSGIDTPTSEELLMRVRIRLGNEPDPEWRAAREHLRRLMRLRITRSAAANPAE